MAGAEFPAWRPSAGHCTRREAEAGSKGRYLGYQMRRVEIHVSDRNLPSFPQGQASMGELSLWGGCHRRLKGEPTLGP